MIWALRKSWFTNLQMLTQPFPLIISIIINNHHLKCSIETSRNGWEGINLNCLASWVNLNVAYCNTICNIKFRNIFDYSTRFFLFKTVYSDYSIQFKRDPWMTPLLRVITSPGKPMESLICSHRINLPFSMIPFFHSSNHIIFCVIIK